MIKIDYTALAEKAWADWSAQSTDGVVREWTHIFRCAVNALQDQGLAVVRQKDLNLANAYLRDMRNGYRGPEWPMMDELIAALAFLEDIP